MRKNNPKSDAMVLTHFGTKRRFKREKRAAVRELTRALEELNFCSAYMPGGAHLVAIDHHLERLRVELSEKNWGR